MSVRYVYIGKREITEGKFAHVFLFKGKKEHFFRTTNAAGIGVTYDGVEDGRIARRPPISKHQIEIDPKTVEQWEAQDLAARRKQRDLAEKNKARNLAEKQKKSNRIREIALELQQITSGMNYFERRYFIDALLDLSTKKVKK